MPTHEDSNSLSATPIGSNGPSTDSTPIGSSNPSTPIEESHSPTTQAIAGDEGEASGVKRKLKSIVWEHFELKKINEIVKAECRYCKKLLGGASKNGTKHLHEHYQRCPRRRVVDMRQKIITNNWTKGDGKNMTSYSFEQDVSRDDLGKMIIMHEYPLSMVDHVGFRRFVGNLQPLFKVPSRNTVKSDILKIYDYERVKTMKLIESNESRVAITTDMWTSTNQKRGFMAVTAHFINSSWTLQSQILRYIFLTYYLTI